MAAFRWRDRGNEVAIEVAPFKITICGIDELGDHRDVGVSHVLSILDPKEPELPVFGSFGEHERVELRFDDVIEESPDLVAPHRRDVEAILGFGRSLHAEPSSCAHLLVHCHAGISRSTAAMALILAQARPELSAATILSEVLSIRSKAWPTSASSNSAMRYLVETARSYRQWQPSIASNCGFGLTLNSLSERTAEVGRWTRR
jgi:predicted protein tyrosine phosphatase